MKIAIIGSGIAGLAASVRLACAGHTVTVLEANEYPGGKLSAFTQAGYRFDAGPSLFTLPQLVNELFELAGKNPQAHFQYIQLERACNYFYEDGTHFTAYHNRQQFANELKQKLDLNDASALFKKLDQAAFRYNLTAPIFIEYSLHRLKNYTNLQTIKGIVNAWRLNLFSTMNEENKKSIKDGRLVQYFNRFATYNGSSPYMAPALLNMIPHLEHNIGTFFPTKGMHQITQSIYQLACELGVNFLFNSRAHKIETQQGRVKGVHTASQFIEAEVVVSNADIYPTFKKLLPHEKQPQRILKQEKSSSALIFYWGISKQFAELDLHNILFSANYEAEFDYLFNKKTCYHDPTIYLNITSKYKPDDAPPGCENWFVMVNVPNNNGQDWDSLIAETRKQIIAKINRMLKVDLEPYIQNESVLDPRSIEAKTSSHLGALYGNASNNKFAAFLRHKNFSSHIKGLYFCGGSVHPGGGIPLCLNSAKIVASLIGTDYKN
jgi:diapolycopene oxygenase